MRSRKQWMNFCNDRLNEKYRVGVEEFLNYAFEKSSIENEIRCPCTKCCNTHSGTRQVVKTHLFVHGIMPGYTLWYHHGEKSDYTDESDSDTESEESEGSEDFEEILRDLYPGMDGLDESEVHIGASSHNEHDEPNDEAKKFYRLLKDSKQPVYPGCETSKLSALVELLHIKSIGRWSNESFDMLLHMLKKLLPRGSTLPYSYYDAKKIVKDLGLSYTKIDACVNDCMLYWKEEEGDDICKICGAFRWKYDIHNGETKLRKNGKKIPRKILRYFPLKPRLQRLFMSTKTASSLRWHHEGRKDDGIMRHPADSKAWKSFDELHKDISSEPRNVRLGLASDGFQPFRHSKKPYSIWPVILIPYNVPPWMCMKQSNFILSMLIPGPEGPGDAIDVYLRPLIDELKELWEVGVETFDASTQQNFILHASLLWTINDFPAYANLSGWSTKGKFACPCCKTETSSLRLVNGNKECYMGHRRYLDANNKWRDDKSSFDGTKEGRSPPKLLSGADVLLKVNDLEGMPLTKAPSVKVKISHKDRGDNWNKKSIFFELSYWSTVLLPHNLDVMHIEKNVCDNVVGTLMNLKGKTKDNMAARLDMEDLKVKPELHLIRTGEKPEMPHACYTLLPNEKHIFCSFLKELKVPDGFSSNVSQCVDMKDHKISGLKSHDCHVLLQHLLPLAIRGLLCKKVCEPLIELSLYFSSLGAKSLRVEELEQLETQIPITLCKLEKIFPPSFFDVMEHLPIHLATEAKIGGPVQYRWMYSVERSMYEMKQFIRNMAHPEGSIAEGYIAKECMTLCSRYLKDTKTEFNKLERNHDGGCHKPKGGVSLFPECGRALGFGLSRDLSVEEWDQAHNYVLNNCNVVQPFLEEYCEIQQDNPLEINNEVQNKTFPSWFKTKVVNMCKESKNKKVEALLSLSRGPLKSVICFKGYVVNGHRFRIEECDKSCRTQNCGVRVTACIGSGLDDIDYYGVLTEILELKYLGGIRVPLFRCRWFDVHDKEKGAKTDVYGFTTINSHRFLKTNEPFILASQASQVFYANDNMNKGWNVVIKTTPRDSYDLQLIEEDGRNNTEDLDQAYQDVEASNFVANNEDLQARRRLQPTIVEVPSLKRKRK